MLPFNCCCVKALTQKSKAKKKKHNVASKEKQGLSYMARGHRNICTFSRFLVQTIFHTRVSSHFGGVFLKTLPTKNNIWFQSCNRVKLSRFNQYQFECLHGGYSIEWIPQIGRLGSQNIICPNKLPFYSNNIYYPRTK